MQTNACAAAAFLKILANDRRLMILCELLKGERSVSELEEIVDLSQSALSQHLARLRRSHLVKTRREVADNSLFNSGPRRDKGHRGSLRPLLRPRKRPRLKKETEMTIDRAVMVFAGCMILLSLALSQLHSAYWLLLTAAVGIQLIQSGFTGFCPAAMLFKQLGLRPGNAFC